MVQMRGFNLGLEPEDVTGKGDDSTTGEGKRKNANAF